MIANMFTRFSYVIKANAACFAVRRCQVFSCACCLGVQAASSKFTYLLFPSFGMRRGRHLDSVDSVQQLLS